MALSTPVGLAFGAVVSVAWWLALRSTFARPAFLRRNHRGLDVPVGAGVVIALTLVTAAAVERLLRLASGEQDALAAGEAMVLGVVGFALLGALDDLAGSGRDRGFRGHLRALTEGRLTTGSVKLVGGGLVALAVVAAHDRHRPGWLLVDVALVALGANLANLLDRAPGRVIKVASLAGAAVLVRRVDAPPAGLAVVVGAALGLAWFDLRERMMLGDAGANALGAAVALGVVLRCGTTGRLVALLVVLVLNAISERVSFSAVIERVGPLRAVDRWGRPAPR